MVPAHDGNSAPITRLGQDYATSKANWTNPARSMRCKWLETAEEATPSLSASRTAIAGQPFGSYGVENTEVILPDGADLFGRGSKGYLVGLRV